MNEADDGFIDRRNGQTDIPLEIDTADMGRNAGIRERGGSKAAIPVVVVERQQVVENPAIRCEAMMRYGLAWDGWARHSPNRPRRSGTRSPSGF